MSAPKRALAQAPGKYEATQPCKSCPYRRDAPLAFWSAEEFTNLARTDADALGSVFACHQDGKKPVEERGLCIGWALDQQKRNLPSIRLRLLLASDPSAAAQFARITGAGLLLWSSVRLMIKANLHAIRAQRRRAKRTA